jgi:hypothetical protein
MLENPLVLTREFCLILSGKRLHGADIRQMLRTISGDEMRSLRNTLGHSSRLRLVDKFWLVASRKVSQLARCSHYHHTNQLLGRIHCKRPCFGKGIYKYYLLLQRWVKIGKHFQDNPADRFYSHQYKHIRGI